MTEGEIIAAITAIGIIVAGATSGGATVLVRHARRLRMLEQRDQLWWRWTKDLIDHIYRQKPPPPPSPPRGLFDDEDDD